MKPFSHPLFLLLTPVAIIASAVLFLISIQPVAAQYGPLLLNLPYILLLLAATLNYRFNQWRLFYAALMLCICYLIINTILNSDLTQYQDKVTYHLLSLLVPLNLLLLIYRPERGIFSPGGFRRVLILGLQISVGFLLFQFQTPVEAIIDQYLPLWGTGGQIPLPSRSLIIITGIFLLSLIALYYRKTLTEACFAALITCSLLSSIFFFFPLLNTVIYGAGAVLILHNVVASSHQMAYQDQLTQLPGRRALEEKLRVVGNRYCVAMVDVDHFKLFNDTHGHDVGDDVLKVVASILGMVSGGGTAYRYGGEEFTILFARKELQQVIKHLEQVRIDISKQKIYLRDENNRPENNKKGREKRGHDINRPSVNVTVSIGVAQAADYDREPFDVFKRADQALYHAKANGRNCLATENELP